MTRITLKTKRLLNIVALIMFLISGCLLLPYCWPYIPATWNYCTRDHITLLKNLEQEYGIRFIYAIGPDFFPPAYYQPPCNADAKPISDFELSRYAQLLPKILNKYPKPVIGSNLKEIAFCKSINYFGVPLGGMYLGKKVYVTSEGVLFGSSDEELELTFHHEFSSILMKNYAKFPSSDWMGLNQPGFVYMNSKPDPTQTLQYSLMHVESDTLCQKGFIDTYSTTTLENDFNMYAETIFTEPGKMRKLVQKYPAIRAKFLLVKQFYLGISPDFSKMFIPIE